jgi:uncharacterized membrane protein
MRRRLMSTLLSLGVLLSAFTIARAASYTFTTIDVPFPSAQHTSAQGINNPGQIVGAYSDSSGQLQGFLDDKGLITTIPDTGPQSINNRRQITGFYSDPSGVHGFLYDRSGFTTLDVPGATLTEAIGINDRTQIVGDYRDQQGQFHSFLLTDGVYSTVDPPFSPTDSGATGINNAEVIVGIWGLAAHGYVNDHGTFTQLDVPGTTTTQPSAINNFGVIAGLYCVDADCHGFTWQDGRFTTVDVPGATRTEVSGINDFGWLVGRYVDSSEVDHGFVAIPTTVIGHLESSER